LFWPVLAIVTALDVVALFILGRLYFATHRGDTARTLALALVCAGAIGNLLDRLRSGMGVVDFLDVGIGDARWPTFNVADMAVSVGAILLAWVLWQEDRAALRAEGTEQPHALVGVGATSHDGGDLV